MNKQKCLMCKKIKERTSFRMLSSFHPNLFNISNWCLKCEKEFEIENNRIKQIKTKFWLMMFGWKRNHYYLGVGK